MLGSTYRLQLHGLGLVGATKIVPYLNELGIETLYLSPFLAATPGSSHGYDVIDPGRIDPAVGTDRDFQGLLDELADRGMHALLDVVPNHMAADPTNAWWWDVLVRGVASPHAVVFDIDWSRHGGRVLVPTLSRPLAEVLAEGGGALADGVLTLDGQPFPVAAGTPAGAAPTLVLADQHFRPAYWRTADTEGNYRRFFDIGSLVGVRVEDPDVFARTHAYIVELCRHPAVAGLRVDHVDGLADPRAYLERLRRHLQQAGSGKVVLVEKILAPDEALDPRWPVEGTTGYEFADRAMGLFLEPAGCARLLELGSELTHTTDPTFTTLADQGKREVLAQSFSGDLDRLTRLTLGALDDEMPGHDLAQRDLRRAWNELTVHLSVYRTYLDGGRPSACDRERVGAAAAAARAHGGPELRRAVATITRALLERAVDEGSGCRWPGGGSSSAGPSWPRASRTRPPTATPVCRCGPRSAAIRTKGVIRSRRSIGWSPHAPEASTPHPPTTRSATRTPGAGWRSCPRRTASGRRSCATGTGCSRHPARVRVRPRSSPSTSRSWRCGRRRGSRTGTRSNASRATS